MNIASRFAAAMLALLAVCSNRASLGGEAADGSFEVVQGQVRAVCTNAGRIRVFYGGVEVARDFGMYCRNAMRRDIRVGFEFPLKDAAARPKVEEFTGTEGREARAVVTWDLNPKRRPNQALAPRKEHHVRVTVTKGSVEVHFLASADPCGSLKGGGSLFFCVPKKSFAGGSYIGVGYPKPVTVCRKFPPPGTTYPPGKRFPGLAGCNSRNGCVLQTAPGPGRFEMAIVPSYGKISLGDGARRRAPGGGEVWRISTGIMWHVDQSFTLEFRIPRDDVGD